LKFSLETIEKSPKVNETQKKSETTTPNLNKNKEISPRRKVEEKKPLDNVQANSSPIKEGKGSDKKSKIKNFNHLVVEEKGLESKIDNLITVLETQRSLCQNSSRKEFVSTENSNTK